MVLVPGTRYIFVTSRPLPRRHVLVPGTWYSFVSDHDIMTISLIKKSFTSGREYLALFFSRSSLFRLVQNSPMFFLLLCCCLISTIETTHHHETCKCLDSCGIFTANGRCEDGGEGSTSNHSNHTSCTLGSDCTDCGPRGICTTSGYVPPFPLCSNFDDNGSAYECPEEEHAKWKTQARVRCSDAACKNASTDCCNKDRSGPSPSPSSSLLRASTPST
jgi:hypothetical protein